ncbi:MAG: hypothetical protein K9N07_09335 [Candidatus Cloacimonetes bacterium]|nr:hypothetical protein [Candidatus Cloacimonadota bacterium]
MKKTVLIVILLILIIDLTAQVSKRQNQNNILYLRELDNNLIETIKIMEAYNKASQNIPYDVLGIEKYQKFLMEMTMICMNLRNDIDKQSELDKEQRELLILNMIGAIKPDVKKITGKITSEENIQGEKILNKLASQINVHLHEIGKQIIEKEKFIIQSKTFDQYYFHLHSQQFIYNLVLNFLKPADKLSADNRAFLIRVAAEVEYNILNSPEPTQ